MEERELQGSIIALALLIGLVGLLVVGGAGYYFLTAERERVYAEQVEAEAVRALEARRRLEALREEARQEAEGREAAGPAGSK